MLLERKRWLGRRVKDMLLLYFLNSVSTEKHLQSQKNPNKKPRREEELQKLGNVSPIIFPSIDSASYFNFFLYKPFINKDWFFPPPFLNRFWSRAIWLLSLRYLQILVQLLLKWQEDWISSIHSESRVLCTLKCGPMFFYSQDKSCTPS